MKHYDKIIDKHRDIKPLADRMTDNKYVDYIEIVGQDNALTEIIFNIKNLKDNHNGVRYFSKLLE